MITVTQEKLPNEIVYVVRVPVKDLQEIQLDAFDRAVMNSPANGTADVLQNLQILAFRQEQQVNQ